jgi:hypothetical protein
MIADRDRAYGSPAMSDRQPVTAQAYLVESFRPGAGPNDLEGAAMRVRHAVGRLQLDGQPVCFRHVTIVAADEALLCVIEAASEELVQLAFSRADVPFDRISSARTNAP